MVVRDKIRRHVYGRRQGHKLHPHQAQLVAETLPDLRIFPYRDAPEKAFATPPEKLVLEIGFGGGEHLAARAQQMPEAGFIGCEPFTNGVAKLLLEIERANIDNIRIHDDDARDLMESLPTACLDYIYLLYPDPWHKLRHHKRRFVCPENLAELFRILKPHGGFMVASDIGDYIRWSLMHIKNHGGFEWAARGRADWTTPPADWTQTRYEAKALRAGRVPTYLAFTRRDTPIAHQL